MSSTSEHGVHWMLSAVGQGMDLATLVGTYHWLTSQSELPGGDSSRTIEQDLPRTFPDDPDFAEGTPHRDALRKVLYAVARHVRVCARGPRCSCPLLADCHSPRLLVCVWRVTWCT